jgi:hypothetical protein
MEGGAGMWTCTDGDRGLSLGGTNGDADLCGGAIAWGLTVLGSSVR